jgi:small-conductance mechanosensitive channel
MRARLASFLILTCVAGPGGAADSPGPRADTRAVMTGDQVVQILDETVDWYRTLGIQQQAATQPSDLLILYANRQTAEKVMALAFEIARANAELLSSDAGLAQASGDSSVQALARGRKQLFDQAAALQAEIKSSKGDPALAARVTLLQGELDLINARRNLLDNMVQFASQSDKDGFGVNALKAHIDAIAASIPSALPASAAAAAGAAPSSGTDDGDSVAPGHAPLSRFGIWELVGTVLRLSGKARTIDTVDQRTARLQEVFDEIHASPAERLKQLAARGDALAKEADAAAGGMRGVRDQYDTLAWLYQQTSSIVVPLSRAGVLLQQYRNNLTNWREATDRQYRDALRVLGLRLAIFAGLLVLVFTAAGVWRRAVVRYVNDSRRRSRLLLLQKIVLWCLVAGIAASTFATQLGSLATFAGLITAGLAVAMQSVLVSVVGYFFLIGKYGIRVGDRVQVGSVTGEVIDLGLVRLHLMELGGQPPMSPTGRVVAFANSIIFQASGGLFKQIPGVNLAWHEVTLSLPAGTDPTAIKEKLTRAVANVLKDYGEAISWQTREIQKASSTGSVEEVQPQVSLRFSASGVEALVRYPVHLPSAAEIDERVSRELLSVLAEFPAA